MTVLGKLELCQDLARFSAAKTCREQSDVLIRSQFCQFFTCVSTIGNPCLRLFSCFRGFKTFTEIIHIAARVDIILIIRDYGTVFINCFRDVRRITAVLFSGFYPIGGIRVRWVLQGGGIHAVPFAFGNVMSVIVLFRLFPDRTFQELIIFRISVFIRTFRQQFRGVIDDFLQTLCLWDLPIMIHDTIPVVRIRIVLEALKHFYFSVPVQFFHQVGKTGIEQLQTSHLPYVGFDHHTVHPFDGRRYLHIFPYAFRHLDEALMEQVFPGGQLIGCKA